MTLRSKRTQRGFTVVEMLIVIVVIGLLTALVFETHNGIEMKTRNNQRTQDLIALQKQLETYFSENGRYPSTTDLGPSSATNLTFIKTNMPSLNKEDLRDPQATPGNYSLGSSTTAVARQYQYHPTDDAGGACDNTTTDCTKYVLTAKSEASSVNIVYNSLN
jgi:prepilin-type N-terminal cleavage/methylation domain-containing protein